MRILASLSCFLAGNHSVPAPCAPAIKCIRIMKLTVLMLLAFTFCANAGSVAQQVSLKVKDAPLREVFKLLKKQTSYTFFFDPALLNKGSAVTINVADKPVQEVLDLCFRNQPFTYSIEGRIITIESKPATPPSQQQVALFYVPPVTITGRVTDENGAPVSGASVMVKGSKRGVSTNNNGEFTMDNVDENAELVITSASTDPAFVKVNKQTRLLITVKLSINNLDAVVVNKGYYSESRRLSTANVGKVTSKEIERQPVSNPLAALVGRVAGLDITQESGLPGTGFTLRLRGLNSVRPEANAPLIIIDGTPYPSNTFDNVAGGNGQNSSGHEMLGYVAASPLNSINPNDIESIEVLKDADATSIYGTRGGNGVILITTKKGKTGKTGVTLNMSHGIAKMGSRMELLNTRQYLDMRYEAIKNDGQTIATAAASTTADLRLWDTTRYTDWQEELLGGTAQYTRGQISISGGNSNTSFLFAGNYSRETTILPVDLANTRYNGRLSVNHQSPNQRLQAQLSVTYGHDNNTLPGWSIASYALITAPIAPSLYDSTGKINWGPGSTFLNPIARLQEKYNGNIKSLVTSGVFSYMLLPGLKLKAALGYNQVQNNAVSKRGQDFYDPIEWLSRGKFLRSSKHLDVTTATWNAEPQVEYETKIGPGKLAVLAGATFQQTTTNGSQLEVNNYPDETLMGNTNFGTVDYTYTQQAEYLYNAAFARVNYNVDSKYILNLTARRDGSSRFAPGKRFGNFASAGAAWLFGEESFVKNALPFLSFGKLRASYGSTGNDVIPNYGYLALYNATNTYAGALSLTPAGLYNNQYSWETNKKGEIGIELAFFKDRLALTTSYYRNRSSNQLVNYSLPSTVGFTSVQSNLPAVVQNTGLELELNTVNIKNKNFSWSTAFNISFPRNKLVSYPRLEASPYANTYAEGMPLSIVKTYDLVRVDPQTGLNVWRSPTRGIDTSLANYLSLADLVNTVNVAKELFGGINNTFRFKQFDLSVFFNFGKQTGPATYSTLYSANGRAYNMSVDRYERRWKQKGDVTDVRRLTNASNSLSNLSAVGNSYDETYYTNVFFVRLKNLAFSYSLPESTLKRMKMQGCRFYIQAQNLFTITGYKGWDPENLSGNYPLLRVWTAGLELNF